MIQTKIDELLDLLQKKKRMDLISISKDLKWDLKALERVSQFLDKAGFIRVHYPFNITAKPWLQYLRSPPPLVTDEIKGKMLETYQVNGMEGHAQAEIKIVSDPFEKRPRYYTETQSVSNATWVYFEMIKDEITKLLPLEEREKEKTGLDRDIVVHHNAINKILKQNLTSNPQKLEAMCGILMREMYGLGDIEILLSDQWLEEIVVNSSKLPIAVYHRKYGWLKSNISPGNEEDIENYAAQIARKIGKQISLLNPILDAHLTSGDRVNATIQPISSSGNSMTLRLFARSPWTVTRFLTKSIAAFNIEIAAFIWQAMHYELNVMVAGGTASGKTSLLNSLVALIQPFQRIITIEDTRELSLPSYQWNWVPLVTRSPNPEGLGEITMLDLVVNSLRMRPDRIIMGEVRRKREAEVLFEAMHTGHSVYGTFHADTAAQVVKRLTEPPIEVPKAEVEDLHLILVQYRDRRKNLRRLFEVAEVFSGPLGPELNYLYVWKPRSDTFQAVKSPRRYTEQLNLHTGMTDKEQLTDRKNKANVLNWMMANEMIELEQVGAVVKSYYSEEESLLAAIEKGIKPDKFFGDTKEVKEPKEKESKSEAKEAKENKI